MMKNEVVFDTASGISIDEQKEILAGIDGAAEKNRLSLSAASAPVKPGKRGLVFPLAVNAACVLLLAGGILVLSFAWKKEDVEIRQGRVVYNAAERVLIREIRRETAERITEKEKEISLVVSRLEDVDAELQEIQAAAGLEAEERREYLGRLQEEYRLRIDTLHDERTAILETSRAREDALRVQLEERAKELAAVSQESGAALAGARNELARLSGEQERLAVIEGQLAGLYAEVNVRAENGDIAGAENVLRNIKEFLDTPAFQGIAAFRSRKEIYVRASDALEAAMRRNGGNARSAAASREDAEGIIAELRAENGRLAEDAARLAGAAAAQDTQGSDLARRVSEYEENIQALRTLNGSLEAGIASREAAIAALQSRNTELAGTAAAQDAAIAELRARVAEQAGTIENLDNQLTSIRQALQALTQSQ
ncbi:MAG: hypothetical protein LBI86_05355 [Treponema sp.]|jgi:uncharacterized coiled-coil protein SlyX|nr:hypothetical protein [Treponema sp.]